MNVLLGIIATGNQNNQIIMYLQQIVIKPTISDTNNMCGMCYYDKNIIDTRNVLICFITNEKVKK